MGVAVEIIHAAPFCSPRRRRGRKPLFLPPLEGEVAARSAGGGGDGRDVVSSASICPRRRAPHPAPFGRDPPPAGEGGDASPRILATRFFAPESWQATARKRLPPNK